MKYRYALGSVIKELRNEQGLNLRQVSGKACMALGYLSEVERGQKEPSSEIVDLIASALEIPTHELIILAGYRMAGIPNSPKEMIGENYELLLH
jgi:transcriptional regulator with XRE-family HTH domain